MKTAGVSSERDIPDSVALVVRCLDDGFQFLHFPNKGRVIVRDVSTDFGKNVDSVIAPIVGNEPAWRFWQKGHADSNEENGAVL